MGRIDKILKELQLEYISHVGGTLKEKENRLPLTSDRDVSGLIWNLLTEPKWRKKISITDYQEIFKRLR